MDHEGTVNTMTAYIEQADAIINEAAEELERLSKCEFVHGLMAGELQRLSRLCTGALTVMGCALRVSEECNG